MANIQNLWIGAIKKQLQSEHKKIGWNSDWDIQPFRYFCFCDKTIFTMNKSSHFIGQPEETIVKLDQ